MWLQPSRWPLTTKLFSGKYGEDILVDGGVYGEVRSETGKCRLFQQRGDGFAYVESSGTRYGAFSGSGEPSSDWILGEIAQDWLDCCMIPAYISLSTHLSYQLHFGII